MTVDARKSTRKPPGEARPQGTFQTTRCQRCGLAMTLSMSLSLPRYCPRCIARGRRITELEWRPAQVSAADARGPISAERRGP